MSRVPLTHGSFALGGVPARAAGPAIRADAQARPQKSRRENPTAAVIRGVGGRWPATLFRMAEKIKLGGMALANGVLVHGPTSWACAVRTPAGKLKAASGRKPRVAVSADLPLL